MKIECTPQELKELIKNTPVAGTTDEMNLDGKKIIPFLEKFHNCQITNYDKPEEIHKQ